MDQELTLIKPTSEAQKNLIGEEYNNFLCDINNLRSVKKIVDIYKTYLHNRKKELWNCIKICYCHINNQLFMKGEYDNFVANNGLNKNYTINNSAKENDTVNIDPMLDSAEREEINFLIKYIKINELLNPIRDCDIERVVKEIYRFIKEGNYEAINLINYKFSDSKLKHYDLHVDEIYLAENQEYELRNKLNEIKLLTNNREYSLFQLYIVYLKLRLNAEMLDNIADNTKKLLDDELKEISYKAANYLFENNIDIKVKCKS